MELAPNPRDHKEEGELISLTRGATHEGMRIAFTYRNLRTVDELSEALPEDGQAEDGQARVRKSGQITEIWRDKVVEKKPDDDGTAEQRYERHILIEKCDQAVPRPTVLWVTDTPYRDTGHLATEDRKLQRFLPGESNTGFPLHETISDITWVRDHIPAEEPANA